MANHDAKVEEDLPPRTAQLRSVPANATGTVEVDGPTSTLTVSSLGQDGSWSFAGSAGQRVYFEFSGGTFASQNTAYVSVLRPDGNQILSNSCGTTCWFDTTTLPVTGTYRIVLNPQATATGSLSVRLSSVPPDASAALTVNGGSATLTTLRGQNASFTFTGAANQVVTVSLTGSTLGSTSYFVRKPDGGTLTSTTSSSSTVTFSNRTLPANGVYTIAVNPSGANAGSVTVTVTS